MTRLNDTAAVPRGMGDSKGCSYESLSVRPIENGFLVTKTCDEDGKYTTKECFSQERPRMAEMKVAKQGNSSMSRATKYLKG